MSRKCNLNQRCSIHMDHITYSNINKKKFFLYKKKKKNKKKKKKKKKKNILDCTETIFYFLCFYKNKYPEPKPTKPSTWCIKITT